jgi:hypothetical protein
MCRVGVVDLGRHFTDAIRGLARFLFGRFAIGTSAHGIKGHIACDVHAGFLALNRFKVAVVCLDGSAATAAQEAYHE